MLQTAREEKTENIHVVMTKKSDIRVSLDIKIEPKAVEKTYLMAIKAVNKEVSLPGFRKGKAPDKMIEKQFKKAIEQEWVQITFDFAIGEALHTLQINPFSKNGIKAVSHVAPTKENGAHLVVEFDVPPTVPEINLENCDLKAVEPLPILEADIQGVVNNVRGYFATFNEVDRPVQDKDFVDLDIEKLDEPKEMLCEDQRFCVEKGQMVEWMRKLVIGLKVGESVEGISEDEVEAESVDRPDFVPTRCLITVKKIQEAILPEVDDAFANRIGMPSAEVMKEKIAHDLTERAQATAIAQTREQLDQWLLKEYPIMIPETMVINEMNGRINTAVDRWKKAGATQDQIKEQVKKQEASFRQHAENSCRLYMILMAYAQRHNLGVTKEEIQQAKSEKMLERFHTADPEASNQEIDHLVAQMAILNKTRDQILEKIFK